MKKAAAKDKPPKKSVAEVPKAAEIAPKAKAKAESAKATKEAPASAKSHRDSVPFAAIDDEAVPKAVHVAEATEDVVLSVLDIVVAETMAAIPHHERVGRCVTFTVDAMVTLAYATVHMGCDVTYDDELSWIGSPEPEVCAGPIDRYAVLSLPRKDMSTRPPKHFASTGDGTRSLSRTHSERSISRTGKRPLALGAAAPPIEVAPAAAPKEIPRVTRVHYPSEVMTEDRRRWRQECMDRLAATAQTKSRWGRVSLIRRVINTIQTDPDSITELDTSAAPPPTALEMTAVATVLERNQPDDTASLYIPTARESMVLDEASVKGDDVSVRTVRHGKSRLHRSGSLESPHVKKPPKAANWFYDKTATENELKETEQAYEPLMSEFQRDKFPQSIELNAGVTLIHGVSVYTGPHRQESPHSMSRKGFRKHLSLPQSGPNKVKLTSLSSASPTFSEIHDTDASPNASPRSEFSLHTTPRRSSLSSNRPNLNSPESVKVRPTKTPLHQHSPAIRVRVSPMKADTPNARPSVREQYVTHGDSVGVLDIPKKRPATALGALLSLAPQTTSIKRSTKSKYLREFPKPKPEVVTVLKDEPQRMAWLG
ncbi:hypothetical protein SDRG_04424 [Saprolegnia diclina VS20]|uniref:Uncharacterized protein n=1 Tax=Saprolegnia diclina (strain VS20) TaxID=1156394 RepID=T0QJ35_SAPDV|nr:hypothetical protein SDRG_04424 [Saprolegnia diclina VS20]EQC37994.1 hypothetical protein SDRG_04424 [Saprolegnia diclina VS20]|eukprot:XP_008608321.1 hypothetical protein SDRG_04424 [Saprolegnia diclina VS20]